MPRFRLLLLSAALLTACGGPGTPHTTPPPGPSPTPAPSPAPAKQSRPFRVTIMGLGSGSPTAQVTRPGLSTQALNGLDQVEIGDVQVRATTDGPTALRTTKQTGKFSVVLRQMGYAFTPSGAGLRYVALGSRKCSSDRVAVAFNSRVSKARAIAISVNGVRKMTFTGSTVRERVFSVPVKSSSKAKITATVVLDSGATVTAARSYLACS